MLLEIQIPTRSGDVLTLHFSNNGEFLASICDNNLLIWRVVDGVQVPSMLGLAWQRSCSWLRQSLDHLSTLAVVEWGIHNQPWSAYLSVTKVHVLHWGKVINSGPISLLPFDMVCILSNPVFEDYRITQSSSGLWFAAWNTTAPGCYVWKTVDCTPAYVTHQLSYGLPHSGPSCARFIGDTQLVIGFEDGTIRWWDIPLFDPATTEELCGILSLPFPDLWRFQGPAVVGLSMSRLHSFLVSRRSDDESVCVLRRTKTRTAQGCLADDFSLHVVLHGHTHRVNDTCFSPCERYIATASDDGTVRLWSTRDGELLWTFKDHSYRVEHVVFSPDGRVLASADGEGGVRIRLPVAMFVKDVPVPPSTILRCC